MEQRSFKLHAPYAPAGDQPKAIRQLVEGYETGHNEQILLGVTGSGKTFTMANVIAARNKPTLVLAHNKILAAQLCSEFKEFFPENAVEYFVSYYDYYQPEAYLPSSDTYIEKDLSINDELEKLRLSATSALLSGRRDVIVVSSVSCLYGIGNPKDFYTNTISIKKGMTVSRIILLPCVAGISYEALKALAHAETPLTRALRWPGLQMQRLTTRQPSDEQCEVAIASMNAALHGLPEGATTPDGWVILHPTQA